jgi:hypothetical protein
MSNLATITNNILADSGIDDINVVVTTGSYANPAWITSLDWNKITGAPAFVTSVTASSPLFSSGGATPNLTIQQATTSQNGFLSSTDWNTFNNKAPSVVGGYLPLSGGTMTGPLISSFNTTSEPFVNATFSGVGGANIGGVLVNGTAQAHVRFLVGSNTWGGAGAKQWQVRVGAGTGQDVFSVYSWTYGNDIMIMNGVTGNVGINSNPDTSSKLTITSTDVHPNVLRLENNNTTINEAGIRMRAINPTGTAFAHADIGVYSTGSDTGNFFIKFPFSNDKQTNVRFALNSAGNLMLGTTTATTGFSRLSLVGGEPSGIGPNTGVQLTYNAGTFGGGAITTVNAQGGGLAFYTFTGNVGSETYALRLTIGNLGAATFTSSVTATSIIRSGGTSSQFLMADGSVNTSVLPSGAYLPLIGGTLTGTLTISGLSYGNTLVITTSNTSGADIRLTNTGSGGKAYSITSTGSGNALGAGGLQFYNETDGVVAFGYTSSRNFLINTSTDAGFRLDVNGTGRFSGEDGTRILEVTTGGATFTRVSGSRGNANDLHVANVEFYNSNSTRLVGEIRGITGTGGTQSNSGQLAFYTNDNGTYAERFRIASTGAATFSSSVDSAAAFYTGGTRSGSMSNIYSSTNNIFYSQSSASGIQAAGTNSVTNGSIVITNTGGTGAYSIIGNAGLPSGYGLFIQSQDRTAASYYPLLLQPNGGNVGINTVSPVQTLTVRGVFGAPLTSGTAQNGIARFGQASGNGCLDFGFGDPYSWLQSRDASTYAVNYALALNPNGGNVLVGTIANNGARLQVSGEGRFTNSLGSDLIRYSSGINTDFATKIVSGANDVLVFRRQHVSVGALDIMSLGFNGNVGIGTNTPLGSINNNGVQIARGGHATLLIGDGTSYGGVVQSSDNTRRVFIGANLYDDEINSWSQFVDSAGYAAFDAIGGDTSGLARILVGSPANSGYGGGDIFFEGYRDNSTSYIRMRTNTGDALFISNAGRTILGSESDNGYKLQVVNGNTWSNGVRIGRDFSITNRATVRLDSNGDEPADILFGRTAAALETGWNGVFWSLSSRGSGEGNNFRIYRGPANTGGSEIIALNINPSAGAATFINTVTATAFFESSDKRLKSNILDLDVNVSSIIAKTYLKNGVEEIGYLAQDIESILPSAISKREDGYLDLSYRQVHTAKIAYLEKRIKELELQLKNN